MRKTVSPKEPVNYHERITCLRPGWVIVSSDPHSGHHLPDLTATAIFAKFNSVSGQMAALTVDTGTIHLRVTSGGHRRLTRFGDTPGQNVDLNAGAPLTESSNPTNWAALLDNRVAGL